MERVLRTERLENVERSMVTNVDTSACDMDARSCGQSAQRSELMRDLQISACTEDPGDLAAQNNHTNGLVSLDLLKRLLELANQHLACPSERDMMRLASHRSRSLQQDG